MTRRAIVTVVTRNYLHFAFALSESVNKHHPESDFYICLADEPPESSGNSSSNATIVYAKDFGVPKWNRFTFQYTPFELSCALKPYAMQHLVDRGYQEVVYLDSDMRLYHPMKEVFAALEKHAIILTPHILKPYPEDGARPGEELILSAGTFNAGFLALRSDATGTGFLQWWSRRLYRDGHRDLADGMFVDQKWLTLVPGLFENVHVLRHPGYNTGHWTLPQFPLGRDTEGHVTIGKHRVVLYHFSHLSPSNSQEFINCQNRFTFDDLPELQQLVDDYHQAIARHDDGHIAHWSTEYDRLDDGTPIHPLWREVIRREFPGFAEVENPFSTATNPGLVTRFRAMERKSRKSRTDWRLKRPKSDVQKKMSRQIKSHVKYWAAKVGARRRAA